MKDAPEEALDFLYADDTTLGVLSDDPQLLQTLTAKFARIANVVNLHINPCKSQILHGNCNPPIVTLDGTRIQVTQSCKYLGVIIRSDGSIKEELKARLASAQRAYFSLYKFFSNRNVMTHTKLQVYQNTIRPILLYQAGNWSSWDESLGVFDRQCLRRIIKAYAPPDPRRGINHWRCWPNSKMMKATGLLEIKVAATQARVRWAGHVSRMSNSYASTVMDVVTRPIEGYKRPPGGQRRIWFEQVMRDIHEGKKPMTNSWRNVQTKAADRERWRKIVATAGV